MVALTSDGHAAHHRDKAFFVAMADLHYAATVAQQLRAPPSPSMARAFCPPPSASCGHSLPHQSPPPAPTVLSRATQPLSTRRPMVNATGSSACGSSSDSSSRSLLLLQQPSRRRSRAATWKAELAGSASLPHSAKHPIAPSTPTQRRGPGSPAALPSQPRRTRRRQQQEEEEEELLEHAWGAVLEAEVGDAMLRQRLDDALAAALRKRRLQQRGKRSQTTRRKASKGATTSSRRSSGHVRLAYDAGVAPPFLLGLNFPLGLARPPRDWRPQPPLPPTAEQEARAGGGPGSRRGRGGRGRSPRPPPPVWKRVALEDVRSRTRSRSKSKGQRRQQQQQDALVGEEVLWALRGRGARPAEVDEVLAISRLRNQPHKKHKKKTSRRPEEKEEAPDGCSSPPPPLRFGQSAWPLPTPLDQPLPPAPPHHKPGQAATSGSRRRGAAGEGSSSSSGVVVVPYSVAADVGTRAVSPTHLLRRPGLRLGHTYSHVGPRVRLPPAPR